MNIERRTGRSASTKALQACIRPFNARLVKPGKSQPAGSPKLSVPRSVKKACTVTERNVGNTWLYDFAPKDTVASSTKHRVYYFAGGGFQEPPSPQHWSLVASLATSILATVTIVSYPLAPNSPAKVSILHLAKLYPILLDESASKNEVVTFMGDSAGGNVAFCLVHYMLSRDPAARAPASILVISPCADCRNDNPAMKATDAKDPLLNSKYTDEVAEAWTKGFGRADPMVSPVLADLQVLKDRNVRLDGLVGTWDVLAPDTLVLLEKAQAAGLSGSWLVWEEQMHCFPLTAKYGLADGVSGRDWIVKTVRATHSQA